MTNYKKTLLVLVMLSIAFFGCKKEDDDDGITIIPERNREEQQIEDNDSIVNYLETHYYNATFFENNLNPSLEDLIVMELPKDEDGNYLELPDQDNNNLLSEDVVAVTTEFFDTNYTYYILNLNQGGGEAQPNFCDDARVSYSGNLLDDSVFDSRATPEDLDLLLSIRGWQLTLPQFNTSETITLNNNGTVDYDNNGLGMMFLPSGLGYFSEPPSGIPVYSPLIFKFELVRAEINDHDGDNVPSFLEDLDGNMDASNDDTDDNGVVNILDFDDDGDGIATSDEIDYNTYTVDTNDDEEEPVLALNEYEVDRSEEAGIITIETIVLTDTNNDGIPDYLDSETAIEN